MTWSITDPTVRRVWHGLLQPQPVRCDSHFPMHSCTSVSSEHDEGKALEVASWWWQNLIQYCLALLCELIWVCAAKQWSVLQEWKTDSHAPDHWQQWCARIPAWLCRHACCTITLRYTLSTTYTNSILRQTANTYFLNIVDNSSSTENKTILWNSTKCDSSRIHQNNLSAGSGSSFPVFAFSPGYLTLLESQLAPDLSHREACGRFGRMHTHTHTPTFSLTFLLF